MNVTVHRLKKQKGSFQAVPVPSGRRKKWQSFFFCLRTGLNCSFRTNISQLCKQTALLYSLRIVQSTMMEIDIQNETPPRKYKTAYKAFFPFDPSIFPNTIISKALLELIASWNNVWSVFSSALSERSKQDNIYTATYAGFASVCRVTYVLMVNARASWVSIHPFNFKVTLNLPHPRDHDDYNNNTFSDSHSISVP